MHMELTRDQLEELKHLLTDDYFQAMNDLRLEMWSAFVLEDNLLIPLSLGHFRDAAEVDSACRMCGEAFKLSFDESLGLLKDLATELERFKPDEQNADWREKQQVARQQIKDETMEALKKGAQEYREASRKRLWHDLLKSFIFALNTFADGMQRWPTFTLKLPIWMVRSGVKDMEVLKDAAWWVVQDFDAWTKTSWDVWDLRAELLDKVYAALSESTD